jgi:hypothetical protein
MRHAISPSSSARSPRIVTERSADNLAEMQSKIHRAFAGDFHNRSTSAALDKLRNDHRRTHDR